MYNFKQVVELEGANDIRYGDKVQFVIETPNHQRGSVAVEHVTAWVRNIVIDSHQAFTLHLHAENMNSTNGVYTQRFQYGGGRNSVKRAISVIRDRDHEPAMYIVLSPSDDGPLYYFAEIESEVGHSIRVGEWEDYPQKDGEEDARLKGWKRIRITETDVAAALTSFRDF